VRAEIPDPPSFEQAEDASRGFWGFDQHWFPTCFVCGPERDVGDGLRIFPGPFGRGDTVACTWVPDGSLVGDDGLVAPEFVWAALDCPGAFSIPQREEGAVVLGELAVSLTGGVRVGEPCVLVAWQAAHEGRKHRTVTVLYSESGECRGLGEATWIRLRSSPSATSE